MTDHISMIHGSGGSATSVLIREVFAREFHSRLVDAFEDAAIVEASGQIAITTDSFVVKPLFYPGGDIGRLSVCGTVNDLLARAATPRYITCGFIIEEGASMQVLRRIARSMAATAEEAGVEIVCGDTKVIEGSGQVMINTTGVGLAPDPAVCASGAREGDAILVSGTLGDHHAAILSERLAVENTITSDNAPLVDIARALAPYRVHSMRDATRGGLATVLKELAEASRRTFHIEEKALPVADEVQGFCGIMGLDPLYMGNEGKMVVILDGEDADTALDAVRSCRYGEQAAIIGHVTKEEPGTIYAHTPVGGLRKLGVLQDEGLPRIC